MCVVCMCVHWLYFTYKDVFLADPQDHTVCLPSSVSGCIGVTLGTGEHQLEGLDGSVWFCWLGGISGLAPRFLRGVGDVVPGSLEGVVAWFPKTLGPPGNG